MCSSPRKRKQPDDSPCEPAGNFKRRNAIRRPGRDLKPNPQLKRAERSEGQVRSSARSERRQPKPDVIPSIDLIANHPEAIHRSHVGDDHGICNKAFEPDEDLEMAKLLHAGMAKQGEMTTELRGRLELLKMYLERHIGAERTLLAYDIMFSAASGSSKLGASASRGSEEAVQLVAEVIGPGKMKYFPILVQAFNLSSQCE